MALFGRNNLDAKLFQLINRELHTKIVDINIDLYKPSRYDSNTNLYGESLQKKYHPILRIPCLITLGDQEYSNLDQGTFTVDQTITFHFLREILVNDFNVFVEVGDIVNWNESFYEIDSVNESQFFIGKNPDTNKGPISGSNSTIESRFGVSHSIICEGHLTRRSSLGIERTDFGNPEKMR